jgi:transcriptional antiterminator NusG
MREADVNFATVCTDVKVPFETVIEVKDGAKREVKRKILPGYILVEMDLPQDAWKGWCFQIKRIQGVTGFLSSDDDKMKPPLPLSVNEVKGIFQKTGDLPTEKVFKPKQTFSVGDHIKIIEGPFESFTGVVDDVNSEKARLRVSVGIFGRSTPVDVDFLQVEKVVL